MITYDLSLERQNLLGADKFSVAAESNETVSFRFHFDRSWRIFDTKAAVFKSSHGKYYVMDIVSNSVTVPWEVLRDTNGFELAIVAYENEVVLTSKKVSISVASSLLPEFCRQLSPTETLFDRQRTEAENTAFLAYKNEIQSMKTEHDRKVIELNEQIADEQQNTEDVREQKDAEIAEINYQISVTQNNHNAEIAALQAQLAALQEKAHNWDLVDTALRDKTNANSSLWSGGTEPFDLPMMNTCSCTDSSKLSVSTYLRKAGFDLSSITSISSVFSRKTYLEEIKLQNTGSIKTIEKAFEACISVRKVDFGNLTNCQNMANVFSGCTSLEEVSIGTPSHYTSATGIFFNCYSLKTVNGIFSSYICTSFNNSFIGCANLETIRFAENSLICTVDFSDCVKLSKESIYSVVNALATDQTATVYFAEHAFTNNLTAEERSEITNLIRNVKHWTLIFC